MTSKNTSIMTTATPWAMAASTLPNFLQHMPSSGPMQHAMPNMAPRMPALTATGANATIASLIRELVGPSVSSASGSTPVCALM